VIRIRIHQTLVQILVVENQTLKNFIFTVKYVLLEPHHTLAPLPNNSRRPPKVQLKLQKPSPHPLIRIHIHQTHIHIVVIDYQKVKKLMGEP
jgi:hypothetical protein